MQWWCSASRTAWEWSWTPYPGVWLFIAVLAAGWLVLRRVASPEDPHGEGEGGGGLRSLSFAAGLVLLWAALDWPIGALGAGYLASVHMLQFLLIAMVAPPLLIHGIPPSALRRLRERPRAFRTLRVVTQPVVAFVLFNVIVGITHWPPVVDGLMISQAGSFVLDTAWLGAGIVLWWPVVSPLPERPAFGRPLKMGYLLLQTIASTGVFAFLVYAEFPVYRTYVLAPPIPGISTRADQQIAGFAMKVGGAFILWTAVTILFARWYREGEASAPG